MSPTSCFYYPLLLKPNIKPHMPGIAPMTFISIVQGIVSLCQGNRLMQHYEGDPRFVRPYGINLANTPHDPWEPSPPLSPAFKDHFKPFWLIQEEISGMLEEAQWKFHKFFSGSHHFILLLQIQPILTWLPWPYHVATHVQMWCHVTAHLWPNGWATLLTWGPIAAYPWPYACVNMLSHVPSAAHVAHLCPCIHHPPWKPLWLIFDMPML